MKEILKLRVMEINVKNYFSFLLAGIALSFSFCSEASLHFLHVPKTAGMSLHALLEKNFKIEEIYLNRAFANNDQFDFLPMLKAPRILCRKFVSAHFPLWFIQKYDPKFGQNFIVTILRDPIERVISYWKYSNHKPEILPKDRLNSPLDVNPNTMCKMFASDSALQGEDLLKSSMENLQQINFIIFQDDFENGVKTLFAKLNYPIPEDIPVMNATAKVEVPEEIIEKIKELNALDIRLYEFANQHLRDKFRK
jgi:hypothetical protein